MAPPDRPWRPDRPMTLSEAVIRQAFNERMGLKLAPETFPVVVNGQTWNLNLDGFDKDERVGVDDSRLKAPLSSNQMDKLVADAVKLHQVRWWASLYDPDDRAGEEPDDRDHPRGDGGGRRLPPAPAVMAILWNKVEVEVQPLPDEMLVAHQADLDACIWPGSVGVMRPGPRTVPGRSTRSSQKGVETAQPTRWPMYWSVLDGLRQPLEEGVIRAIREGRKRESPSRFLLVGRTNPCPGVGRAQPVHVRRDRQVALPPSRLGPVAGPLRPAPRGAPTVGRGAPRRATRGVERERSRPSCAPAASCGSACWRAERRHPRHRLDELAPRHTGGHAVAAPRAREQPAQTGPAPGSSCRPHAV